MLLLGTSAAPGCTWLPSEFNLSPLYRQRLDEDGRPLEVDVLWPVFHYERTPDGGHDCRIRPFYRRVTEPETHIVGRAAVEHQYLWPLGRHRSDGQETSSRLFPLYWWRARPNGDGQRETDWYALFPFLWGGTREDGAEDYFGVFPFYADLPDFLTYNRLLFVLWPLYTRTEKDGRVGNVLLWPFAGWGHGPGGFRWHRIFPLWMYAADSKYWRWSLLWPFLHWGVERRDSDDPVQHFLVWPLWGQRWSDRVFGWTTLWPLFEGLEIEGRSRKLSLLWPFFKFEEDSSDAFRLYRWWLWPVVARTVTDRQLAWVFLWPLIWLREYRDPEGVQQQDWVLPFYWRVHRDRSDGGSDDFVKVWPLFHVQSSVDADGNETGDWSALSIWPYREGNAYGIEEAYGFLWTLAKGRRRASDDESMELIGNLYTTRRRGERRQTSVPLLFSYEGDAGGGTVWLLQCIPIPWTGTSAPVDAAEEPR